VKVGWWDLAKDEAHPDSPEQLAALVSAVESWKVDELAKAEPPREELEQNPQASLASVEEPIDPVALLDEDHAPLDSSEVATNEPREPCEPLWDDLASNVAGAAPREQAKAAKEAAPVRTALARALGIHTEERAWRVGAVGEEKVAAQLAKVVKKDPRWRVVHSVPVGKAASDIDHVVIGPGGVFTVNTKHHKGARIWVRGGTFIVNGTRLPYLRNSRHEAERASALLTKACGFQVDVDALIVPVNADELVVKGRPDGASVVSRKDIVPWLRGLRDLLTESTTEAIYEAARRSTTWRT
jgi:hypothetical protein